MSKAETVREDVSDKKYTMDEIEEIERLVRVIHEPQDGVSYNSDEQERLYDRKVLYYIKLGASLKEIRVRAKKTQKQRQDERISKNEAWSKYMGVTVVGGYGGAAGYSGYSGVVGYSGYSGPSLISNSFTESVPCSSSLWRGPEKKAKKKVQKKEPSLSISAVSKSRSGWGNKPQGCTTLEVKGRECRKNSCSA